MSGILPLKTVQFRNIGSLGLVNQYRITLRFTIYYIGSMRSYLKSLPQYTVLWSIYVAINYSTNDGVHPKTSPFSTRHLI